MEFYIYRNMNAKKINYYINNHSVEGSANITLGIIPIKITVKNGNKCIVLKQAPLILKLINALPLLNYETFTPFKIYKDNLFCGRGAHILFRPIFKFKIEGNKYELRHHSDNYISLLRENKQIALFQKKSLSIRENRSYFIKCVNEAGILDIIMLFCAFSDVIFYPNNKSVGYLKWDKTYVFNDKYANRTHWNP